jgi:hypothetical protein
MRLERTPATVCNSFEPTLQTFKLIRISERGKLLEVLCISPLTSLSHRLTLVTD